ncbi:prolyl oligopeptidase family serine peptidase [Roseomonas xinghualingensis]|uniref:prolyl oligopeptidase family serine peptidase n=1 Tax=Roseomonas xinghualingensis TaxID=2986475 RepID=UPI0021F1ED2E|nr:prolyl oligopeptidase family serine peptidase [Roseomonas sp. SXEYE001]MCV4209267.1 prolyl oligopeptidase family serine peptidase [Roseomonas sp. SXEYE001]
MSSSADPRPTLAAPDDDPWFWLEEVEGERALTWVAKQNAATLGRFADARYAADRDAVKAALDRPDKLPFVTRRGAWLYNFWQDAAQPRGIWRRTTLESYRSPEPEWDMLLDLDALARDEGEDWVWQGASTLPGTHDRAMLRLSRGGGDAVGLREFDLGSRLFVAGGFVLPEAKSSIDWLDRDTLLLSSALGEGMATHSGYARTIRLWSRGTDPALAPVIFECGEAHMGAWGRVEREAPGRVIFIDQIGFYDTAVHIGDRTGPLRRIELPSDAEFQWQRGWLAVQPRSSWAVEGTTHSPDTLLGIGLDAFLAGDRGFQVLFTPAERRALQEFFWCDGRLVVSVLDELQPDFTVFTPGETGWPGARLPGLPETGVAHLWPLDSEPEESDGSLLAQVEDPITPPSLLLTDTSLSAPALLRRSSPTYDASGLIVTRHEAISVDGERIPYVQTGPARETGEAPVHLSGYGGFRVSRLPHYQGMIGKLWLEKGGTTVVANIRGGGEFGTRWHEAGRRERKQLSHDDFAAVAADLAQRGVTRPGRIAAEGGSNGGLLIANMLTRYPERFGALFCTIPLIDMRRYNKLLAGASWVAEYGDPDKPEDWEFLRHISAYHMAEPGRAYPPILLATTRRDDRVHPGHARKMAAKLQAMGYPAWFYEPAAGGHGYGKDNAEVASFAALGSAFLRRAIGWEPEAA